MKHFGIARSKKRHVTTDKLIAVDPRHRVSEQFRTIRTNISFSRIDKDIKSIVFTSSELGEGKSTVTANMAITWAQQGKRVLLIDADLRRPVVHSIFKRPNKQGLTNVLTSNSSNNSAYLSPSGIENLTLMTSGPQPPNPGTILNSLRMKTLLKQMEKEFDLVVLDVPPMMAVADTQELTSYIDGTILVVRQGVVTKSTLKRSVELLNMAHSSLLGYVMNDVGRSKVSRYNYYH